jgi:hypothetical protein
VKTLNVGIASWIIQDGNYPDFEAGKEYRFALEMFPIAMAASRNRARYLEPREGCDYAFCGQVVLIWPEVVVLDAGILIYRDGRAGLKLRLSQLFINVERAWAILRIGIPAASSPFPNE